MTWRVELPGSDLPLCVPACASAVKQEWIRTAQAQCSQVCPRATHSRTANFRSARLVTRVVATELGRAVCVAAQMLVIGDHSPTTTTSSARFKLDYNVHDERRQLEEAWRDPEEQLLMACSSLECEETLSLVREVVRLRHLLAAGGSVDVGEWSVLSELHDASHLDVGTDLWRECVLPPHLSTLT